MTDTIVAQQQDLYQLAKAAIEAKQRWTAGEAVTIWADGNGKRVDVHEAGRDGGGLLVLGFYEGRKARAWTVCGTLHTTGWSFSLDKREYNAWVTKAKGEHLVELSVNVEAQKWGDKLTPAHCKPTPAGGGSWLSPEAEKARSWAAIKHEVQQDFGDKGPYFAKDGAEVIIPSPAPNPALIEILKAHGFTFEGGFLPCWSRSTAKSYQGGKHSPEAWLDWARARYAENWPSWGTPGEWTDGNGWQPCRIVEQPGSQVNAWGTITERAGLVIADGKTHKVGSASVRAVQR